MNVVGMTTKEWRECWWRVDRLAKRFDYVAVAMIGSLNQRGPVVALSRAASRILKRMPGRSLLGGTDTLGLRVGSR